MGRSETNMKKLKDLINTINKLENEGKEISIEVKNTNNNEYGVATLLRNNEEVKVFEGNPDGRDDCIYTIEEFDSKYEIQKIIDEYEEEYE